MYTHIQVNITYHVFVHMYIFTGTQYISWIYVHEYTDTFIFPGRYIYVHVYTHTRYSLHQVYVCCCVHIICLVYRYV